MIRIIALGTAILAGAPAFAHVSFDQSEAPAGASTVLKLRVPHGCDGAATTGLHVEVPEGVSMVKPMPKPGWTVETEMDGDRVSAITWSGGSLPDAYYDEFGLRASVEDLPARTQLAFQTTQMCGDATEEWTGDHAPQVSVTSNAPQHHHGHADASATSPITVEGAFARATLPGAPVGGGYLTVKNTGSTDDRLVSASSDIAESTSIHEMIMSGDTMRMSPLPDGIVVPAGGGISLAPATNHLMFDGLKGPLTEGDTITVTLQFENAGEVEVSMPVMAINADGAMHHHNH
ncbi:copper chaperone PCu(A)C [Falsirhodobacter sp. alg1]|uniref:copper chaperone PCu(A)C n=1 Tax=Falsirhodobacter sp. alg1 TaxID=1472418 RepID=UPI0005EE7477|nr:copper chaperone PCu(A)C [Falsirhodobacter sp. alg1]